MAPLLREDARTDGLSQKLVRDPSHHCLTYRRVLLKSILNFPGVYV